MPANWGVIEQLDESNRFIAFHVVPLINLDGQPTMSAAHELSSTCPCRPFLSVTDLGFDMLNHHDPDHPGALPDEEYQERAHSSSV